MPAGRGYSVAEPSGFALADVVDFGHLGDGPDLSKLVKLAALFKGVLEFHRTVEVILEAGLAPSCDHQNVGEPTANRFLDHVLDGRLVDEREHLLGHGLGGREESGSQPGGRYDGFAKGHLHVLPSPADPAATGHLRTARWYPWHSKVGSARRARRT